MHVRRLHVRRLRIGRVGRRPACVTLGVGGRRGDTITVSRYVVDDDAHARARLSTRCTPS